jgi:methyl-accepting chemotaxis protein
VAQSNGTITALSEKSHHQSGELESNAQKMNDMQKHIAQLEHDNAAKQDSIVDLNRFFIFNV